MCPYMVVSEVKNYQNRPQEINEWSLNSSTDILNYQYLLMLLAQSYIKWSN